MFYQLILLWPMVRYILNWLLCSILFLPTVTHYTVFLHSHITYCSYVFRRLLTPSSGSFISTAVPSQLLFVCDWWDVRLVTFCYEFTHWIHLKIVLYLGSILFTCTLFLLKDRTIWNSCICCGLLIEWFAWYRIFGLWVLPIPHLRKIWLQVGIQSSGMWCCH
jgi:hypothetical protein